MVVERFGSDGREVHINIDSKCAIKRKQWLHKPKQIKTIRNNESSPSPHKFHVKPIHRWPADQFRHHHGHCMEWWMFAHRMPMPPLRVHQWTTALVQLHMAPRNRLNQSHPRINRAHIEPCITTTGKKKKLFDYRQTRRENAAFMS